MDGVVDIHPLDLGAMLQDPKLDIIDIVITTVDGTDLVECPAGSGKLYRQTLDVPVTSEWGKQVLEDAKHVNLQEE